MKYQEFCCPECREANLQITPEEVICGNCHTIFPIWSGVPLFLPKGELSSVIEGKNHRLSEIQAVYDRAYQHGNLMGTELDLEYDEQTKKILLGFAGELTKRRVLDVGTGVGNLWNYMPAGVDGYAIDPSKVGVAHALKTHPDLTVSASVGEQLPYRDNFFDVVVAADSIEHTFSPEKTLQEIHRVMKPGGDLCASFPIPDSLRKWGWNQIIKRNFNPAFVLRLVKVVIKRFLLFGRANFQPIDRDIELDQWKRILDASEFIVQEVVNWPAEPEEPIVYLVHAKRR